MLEGIDPATPASDTAAAPQSGANASEAFQEAMLKAESFVVEPRRQAKAAVEDYVAGGSQDIHDVMVSMEKAGVSLKFMVSVRNKVLDAYRQVMRMEM